jgi:protein phosphatase
VDFVARTDTGRLRQRNEDSVAVDDRLGVALVADGMGGLRDGHVASRLAVDTVLAHLQDGPLPGPEGFAVDVLDAALQTANQRLRRHAGSGMMGTTVLLASVGSAGCRVAHVGDSRAYLVTGGSLQQLTRDHSLVQELVDQGLMRAEQARLAPNRNVITRALGLEPKVLADTSAFTMTAGDLLLLCSDGLWDMLEDGRIADLLQGCGQGQSGLAACADALVDGANDAGGHDNVSVVLGRA